MVLMRAAAHFHVGWHNILILRIGKYALYIVSFFFCVCMFFTIFWTPMIGELDDVRMVQFIGLPIALISTALGIIISKIKSYRISSAVLIVNTICISSGLLGTYEGIIDLLTNNFHMYHGHQGNNYSSSDLLIVSTSCLFLLFFNGYFYMTNRKQLKKNEVK